MRKMTRTNMIGKQFDEERALYHLQHADVTDCVFAGPADGESALKEAVDDKTRAAIWYAQNGDIADSVLGGIKAARVRSFGVMPSWNVREW